MASYFYTNFIFALLYALFVIQALKFSHSNALTNVSCIGAEREVLRFKQNLTDPLRCLSSWTGKHCCEWDGVKCNNRTGHILELHREQCDLGGKVLPALSELKHLKYLGLGRNNFIGHLPGQFGDFKDLEVLDLESNLISGPIPATMGQLSSLRYLFLDENNLSGNIPESIGQLSNLIDLDFRNNRLDGVVSKLHLANLTSLTYFMLSLNKLVINISASWVPPFQLKMIYLSSCKVGPEFPNWLRTQRNIWSLHMSNAGIATDVPHWLPDVLSNIRELDLSSNMLRGNIFEIVGKRTPILSQLSLSGNNLTGDISNFTCMFDEFKYLDLSKNQLSGRLSPCWGLQSSLFWISLGDNKLNGHFPSFLCALDDLQVLGLHKNGLNGVLPECLIGLYSLEILDLGDNWFGGRIPPFSKGFKVINLERNYFTGDIPWQLCHNFELQYLSLAHNNLSGGIPPCFSDFLQMWADSSFGGYPMDGVRRLFFVMVVNIKGISLEFTTSLQYLFSIDLSSNALEGQIPEGLTRLVQLQNLNLSRNKLIGKIPLDIGNLRYLESLDLSNNKLLGEIPSISNLYFLSRLDLSFNNLSGPIPSGNQLSTLDDQSVYRGNHALCGAPLLKVCSRDEHNEGDSR
ncbi:receptor-like protein EIX1 [Eucalyptus grandis]|uniref:receptor-like protein EIX1 n=1 Tax=Eucalyptus grandis TaxID=71139 RepID=UPI00192E8971|nr:receptor-like protein EIX1 [Eucalyptus grandis]